MKPILFNTEMVRAILDNRKAVTRRVVKPQPAYSHNMGFVWKGAAYGTDLSPTINGAAYNFRCASPYRPGDILYVRETWDNVPVTTSGKHGKLDGKYFYKADGDIRPEGFRRRWYPSIHMPREAARIFLRVTNVRVERLQDITESQAIAEGCNGKFAGTGEAIGCGWEITPQDEFSSIWNSTIKHADRALYIWEANSWVWVIEFERCEKPEKGDNI